MSTNPQDGYQPTVVLVHGGWADGSGWQGVYHLLKDTYSVRIVQEPNLSHEGDVAATKFITGQQSEPVILVAHSYGGAVITEAGNAPEVAASCISRLSCQTRASQWKRSSEPSRPACRARVTLFCRRRTASCYSTGKRCLSHSRAT